MKRAILGALVGVGLVMAAVAVAEPRGEVIAPNANPVTAMPGAELIVATTTALRDNTQIQMLTIVDPRQRVLAVYHIDVATGRIALKSVRYIQYDLQINDLNTENPLPQQIRSMFEKK